MKKVSIITSDMRQIFSLLTKKNIIIILGHSLFWILYILIPHIVIGIPIEHPFIEFKMFETLILMVIFYINANILVPKLLLKKRIIVYTLIVGSIIFGGMEISKQYMPPKIPRNSITIESENKDIQKQSLNTFKNIDNENFKINHLHKKMKHIEQKRANFMGVLLLIIFSLSTGYRYAMQMYSYEKKMKEFETAHIASELQLLKSQINPHFLFNTLNSIYSLSIKKSEDTPKAILQLSEMLRYITYDTTEQFVPLQKEITYIQNYIALQKMRVSTESNISFTVSGNAANHFIAPMLLLPFIENACKHGISAQGNLQVKSHIIIKQEYIDFTVQNTIYNTIKNDENKGIGIENVQRRLQALYPQRHTFQTKQTTDTYSINLVIYN